MLAVLGVLRAAPYLLGAAALLWGGRLVEAVGREPFSRDTAQLCDRTALACRMAAEAAVILALTVNLLQLMAFSLLVKVDFQVELNLLPLALAGAHVPPQPLDAAGSWPSGRTTTPLYKEADHGHYGTSQRNSEGAGRHRQGAVRQVGITEANLSILRSGKANGVRFHTINRICYYLGCDVGDILRFDGRLEDEHEE